MTPNQILKIYGTDFKENTKRLLTEADLASMIPDPGSRIGIKPNLVSPSPAGFGATTHPEIVAGILEYLQENGFRNLTVLEGSWVGDKTMDAFQAAGYDRICEQYRVPFFDTQKDSFYEKDCAGLPLKLCNITKEIDFLINVPVLKGHCQTKITCALKNLKGLIPNSEKRRFHSLGLHKPIAHLNSGIRQDFIVIDHICGDLDFEDGGNPVVRNCIMAATDPVLADTYVCHLLHYQLQQVPYISMASALGCGSMDLKKARIRVVKPAATRETEKDLENGHQSHPENTKSRSAKAETETTAYDGDEELPYVHKVVDVEDAVEEVESCSACYGYLIPALHKLKEEGLFDFLPDKICIGQGWRGKSGSIGVGNCTAGFDFCVRGCPPTEMQIYEALKRLISSSL